MDIQKSIDETAKRLSKRETKTEKRKRKRLEKLQNSIVRIIKHEN